METSKTRDANADDMRRIAAKLESEHPRWLVMYGAYSAQLVAFPRFDGPRGCLTASYPVALAERMNAVEAQYHAAAA